MTPGVIPVLRRVGRLRLPDEVDAAENDEHAAYLLENGRAPGFFVPVQVMLDDFGERAREDDDRTMPDAVGRKQDKPVHHVRGGQFEGDAQHGGHVGERARTERDAKDKAQDESRQHAFAFHADSPRTRPRVGNHVQQVQPDDEEDGGDEVVSPRADIAHHAAGGRRDRADGDDRDKDAHGEQGGDRKRPLGRDASLLVNKADDKRDAGQVAGAQQDAENAPDEGGAHGDPWRALHRARERGDPLFHPLT